eukprot:gnl/MRDRNA2_/MRDRNA2_168641_c0_seq1.p1 gnl/MRDRNA2_/MRDRNA2_168641_c0~~gnl/MRDRNA2_/MRDRNA2_168641_c0_seq1.p1  ORF type:complete len:386 (+),score=82.82 gnl/MRDRNA2_/MRDRNA2_168641_c0_seq1:83-1159(+)
MTSQSQNEALKTSQWILLLYEFPQLFSLCMFSAFGWNPKYGFIKFWGDLAELEMVEADQSVYWVFFGVSFLYLVFLSYRVHGFLKLKREIAEQEAKMELGTMSKDIKAKREELRSQHKKHNQKDFSRGNSNLGRGNSFQNLLRGNSSSKLDKASKADGTTKEPAPTVIGASSSGEPAPALPAITEEGTSSPEVQAATESEQHGPPKEIPSASGEEQAPDVEREQPPADTSEQPPADTSEQPSVSTSDRVLPVPPETQTPSEDKEQSAPEENTASASSEKPSADTEPTNAGKVVEESEVAVVQSSVPGDLPELPGHHHHHQHSHQQQTLENTSQHSDHSKGALTHLLRIRKFSKHGVEL